MAKFVRKNKIVVSGTFVAADGSGTQPTSAEAVLTYTNLSGTTSTDTVALTNTAGVWKGSWDSSNAGPGSVEWTIFGYGALVAALDGSFVIKANKSNLTLA